MPEAYKRLRAKCYQGLDAFDLFHGFTENNIHEQAFSDDIQALIVMEAMKMEHTIKAGFDGKVEKIFFNEGDLVEGDVELISLSSDEKE